MLLFCIFWKSKGKLVAFYLLPPESKETGQLRMEQAEAILEMDV